MLEKALSMTDIFPVFHLKEEKVVLTVRKH
jgi:hypothetical protein